MEEMVYEYEKIRDRLTTMSCLMCEHKRWPYRWIGHTAGVVVQNRQVQVFESTSLNKWSGKCGVQLHPMSTWLKHYNGKVWVRIYKDADTPEQMVYINQFIEQMLGCSYPSDKIKLFMAWFDFQWNGRDVLKYKGQDKGVFCTQLFMAWYKYPYIKSLLESLKIGSEYIPSDMDSLSNQWADKIRIK